MTISHVGVVIPACNEEATVGGCLSSVLTALRDALRIERCWIALVADSCMDRTADLARRVLEDRGEVLTCDHGAPGAARKDGADAVLRHFASISPDTIWLASTDADTVVPPDWIDRHLQLARDGISAVAGIVDVAWPENQDPRTRLRFASSYLIDADGTHPHVHGANLGVRADAYLDAGGWSNASVGEDHCLWNRVNRKGWKTRAVSASVVTTSGRLFGRACGGFADALRQHATAEVSPC